MLSRDADYQWHYALNDFNKGDQPFQHWMYDAKSMSTEVPRMAILFRHERQGSLLKTHKQCSHSGAVPITENKLTCAIGVECKKCPYLVAIDKADMSADEKDEAKAWTCAAHLMTMGNTIDKSEGWILTEDDKMFWTNVYESMSGDSNEQT